MIYSLAAALGFAPTDPVFWLPLVFLLILFITILAGTILDGFDLGVGCLSLVAPEALRPRMMALLSPWRDANEFWLFLGVAVFAVAFPQGWAEVMAKLSFPLMLLALGVMTRSLCFELRLRAAAEAQPWWQLGFALGSVLTAFAHGFLLAKVIVNYETGTGYSWFFWFMGFCAVAAYVLLGAAWLVMREEGELRMRAVIWGRRAVRWFAAGVVAASVVLALANPGVLLKWSDGTPRLAVLSLWSVVLLSFVLIEMSLPRLATASVRGTAWPFLLSLALFVAVLLGLAFSFFPFLILDQMTVWDAAADELTLRLLWKISLFALPFLVIFTFWVYWRMFGLSRPPTPPDFKM